MKILGVHPGPLMYTKIFLRLEPLGLELVAAAAREAGHEVQLIDLQVENHKAFFRLIGSWRPDIVEPGGDLRLSRFVATGDVRLHLRVEIMLFERDDLRSCRHDFPRWQPRIGCIRREPPLSWRSASG